MVQLQRKIHFQDIIINLVNATKDIYLYKEKVLILTQEVFIIDYLQCKFGYLLYTKSPLRGSVKKYFET